MKEISFDGIYLTDQLRKLIEHLKVLKIYTHLDIDDSE